jgi:undecaprenyl-diphosphatase
MAAAMALSRAYAGVHHMSDVVAGAAVGAVTGTAAARI